MRDGVGRVQRALLIGGTSEIGLAILAALRPSAGAILAGRSETGLARAAEELARRGVPHVATCSFVAGAGGANEASIAAAVDAGHDIDVVIVAVGELGDQAESESVPARAAKVAVSTYVGGLEGALIGAGLLREQGHGSLVVLSSVAALRPRRSNFVYGSAKAGLDFLARGLREPQRGSGPDAVLLRPGRITWRLIGAAAGPPARAATGA
ncbi:MAG: SDR family NAD(P)-dependent oxidoreductase, partial [bacterium]